MTCQDLAAFMLDYVEGTLPPDVRHRFDEHLAVCDDCVHYLTDYRATIAGARALGESGVPEAVPAMPEALVRAILHSRGT